MKKSILIIFLFSILFQTTLYSQVSNDVIVLSKKGHNKKRIIKQNKKIKVWINENGVSKKYKGHYNIVNNEMIRINDKTFHISEINQLSGPSASNRITGGVLLALGTTSIALGTAIFIWGINSDDSLGFGFLIGVIIGVPLAALGIILDTTGAIFMVSKKTYDLNEKWDIQISHQTSVY